MARVGVPSALYEPLLARLYTSGADIGLAQAAATIGRAFSATCWPAVVPRQPECSSWASARCSTPACSTPRRTGVYWFRHALIRDVAYDLQPRDQRAAMHRRVGDALRARRGGRRGLVGRHRHPLPRRRTASTTRSTPTRPRPTTPESAARCWRATST